MEVQVFGIKKSADTRKALKVYQKQNKLPVTGRLNDSTLAKLKTT